MRDVVKNKRCRIVTTRCSCLYTLSGSNSSRSRLYTLSGYNLSYYLSFYAFIRTIMYYKIQRFGQNNNTRNFIIRTGNFLFVRRSFIQTCYYLAVSGHEWSLSTVFKIIIEITSTLQRKHIT